MFSPKPRYAALDIARGIAICGTLATNIWIFSHPGGLLGYFDSPTSSNAAPWQQTIEAILQALPNGKFLGLLTLLFGIGLALQAESASRRGHTWPGPYQWRMCILFLDGILHYLLVVEFDILMGYAVTGGIAAWVITFSERTRKAWFTCALAVHALLVLVASMALMASMNTQSTPAASGGNPYRDGSWCDLVLLRIDSAFMFRIEPVFILPMSIAMFLLGHRLYQSGILTEKATQLRRRLIIIGLITAPIDLALSLSSPALNVLTRYGTAPVVAVGMFALIVSTAHSLSSGISRSLAALGRVSLSAYMLQNLVASALFYGWGLNVGAMDPQWRLPVTVAAWIGISALMLVMAHYWLLHFRHGPMEMVTQKLYRSIVGAPEATSAAGNTPRIPHHEST
ncbi:DUF418 domain-containing protein [Dermatophilus congolensis]|uniref:DUF418 domain-containing protein n=1 Tax=Dermatophilus congolensis TaxID=1863 RepID=UPI001AAE99C2|nr:DUF418 domain-containing protein [Dermatophilus congolensis]MBO3130094.1 DUF418 domain-containing protein [Dermatophilus congolensis]MBO3131279.1 DUF418 domain-containing protein [Dermatophilus congolensis]MBO3134565.1 DUF418 domain-containing protein [Dermatophilus congolensis]MBO3136802.1 DUF418 domain-containing protein [Dermatophilus congolensis]MBO3139046.1 DUF418 domain-containing protein [Dermatophilus congolensis]